MTQLADLNATFQELFQDSTIFPMSLASGTVDTLLIGAAEIFSKDYPLIKTVSAVAAGLARVAVPTSWQSNFSTLLAAEYPMGGNPPNRLDLEDDVVVVEDSGAEWFLFLSTTPTGPDSYQVTYSTSYDLSVASRQVRTVDEVAVLNLALSFGYLQLGCHVMGEFNPTVDIAGNNGLEFLTMSTQYRTIYTEHVRSALQTRRPAAHDLDVDVAGVSGRKALFHSRKRR